jgi:galactokinase
VGGYRAPGRVNLIGEHTDYNDGFVLPVAVDRYCRVTWRRGEGTVHRVRSVALGRTAVFGVRRPRPRDDWTDYVRGVTAEVARTFPVRPVTAVIDTEIPLGAGLGSSAALEVAFAGALVHCAGVAVTRRVLADLCWRAETGYVGVPCGIMDQYASALARRSHALWIDCRSRETRYVPVPADVAFVVLDSGVRRRLAGTAYAQRRRECGEAVERLRRQGRPIQSLRDLTSRDLNRLQLPPVLARRVRHVVGENARVLRAVEALRRGDMERMGKLLGASHVSLRDDYAVSHTALDLLVRLARRHGAWGARLVGAGFGGSVLALVPRDVAAAFAATVQRAARKRGLGRATAYVCNAAGGARAVRAKTRPRGRLA